MSSTPVERPLTIGGFQRRIEAIFGARDAARSRERNLLWFHEEVGELSRAMIRRAPDGGANLREEFADVLAWLASLASLEGISLEDAVTAKYANGCPKCKETPCACA